MTHRARAIEAAAKAIYESSAYGGPFHHGTNPPIPWDEDGPGHYEFDRNQDRIRAKAAIDAAEKRLPPKCPECLRRSDIWSDDSCVTCAHLSKRFGTPAMTIPEFQEYLDECIRYWRNIRDAYGDPPDPDMQYVAVHYIDAFQSVRSSFFGELLP